MSTAELSVPLYNDGGVYKHWTLRVVNSTTGETIEHQALGSSTRYRYERQRSNARQPATISEIIPICQVDCSKIPAIEAAAQNAVIHNEAPGYNCQDYVLELLGTLEEEGVIDGDDEEYKKNKAKVQSKVEGLI